MLNPTVVSVGVGDGILFLLGGESDDGGGVQLDPRDRGDVPL